MAIVFDFDAIKRRHNELFGTTPTTPEEPVAIDDLSNVLWSYPLPAFWPGVAPIRTIDLETARRIWPDAMQLDD